jgi:copper homeostasis protein
MGLTLEVCVDTVAGLAAAVEGGADRVELCSALGLGGLTPSVGMMQAAAGCGVPVMAMIRPRAGDFVWSEAERVVMKADIAAARNTGLAGVVLGASLPDGRLDVATLAHLVAEAKGLDLTLHRCFDLVPDMGEALEAAVKLGFRRVLTSGGAATAEAGAARLRALVDQAGGRISIMAGAGVTVANAPALLALGVRELHGSCAESFPISGRISDMGFGQKVERCTSAALVRALKQVMEGADSGVQRHL